MAKAEKNQDGQARAWQRMLSGRRLDLIIPSPLDIEISDIAHGLARVARWNGQTKGIHAYSVAQHSLLVEHIYCRLFNCQTPDEKQLALLHDAPEYVIGDMISPFKAVMGGNYQMVEKRLEDAIHVFLLTNRHKTQNTETDQASRSSGGLFRGGDACWLQHRRSIALFWSARRCHG